MRLAADIVAWEAVGRPVALTITYEMIRSTITLRAAYPARATPAMRR